MRTRLIRRIKELDAHVLRLVEIIKGKDGEIEELRQLLAEPIVSEVVETTKEEAKPSIWKKMSEITEAIGPKGGK